MDMIFEPEGEEELAHLALAIVAETIAVILDEAGIADCCRWILDKI